MHQPFFIAYSPYNHYAYTKMMIKPLYMQVSPAVVPFTNAISAATNR